ncbi:MAG TPA: glutamine synthetase family protein [Candidatus Binatia bacterium]|nr:glutamine synthetase family protein [Candidatus Binatia bacterium]
MPARRNTRGATSADRLTETARKAGVRLVRFLYTDNGGVTRGKATYIGGLRSRIDDGIGLTVAMQAMNMLDQLAAVEGMGPVGEIRLVPDPATFRILPYAPHSAAMTVDMCNKDGSPWEACPRSFLKRQIAACASAGFTVQAAFECEFTFSTRNADGTYAPLDESLCFSSVGFTTAAQVMDAIIAALEAQNIEVDQYYPELGHGQHELPIRHAPALAAADRQVFFRDTVRNVAYQHSLYASLAPKPFPDQAGNGAHIHFSLWDKTGKRNVMYDPKDQYGVSKLGYQFIAGVLDHLPALLALTCPSYNSYHRLQPHFWSSAYTAWGPDNREGAIRVPSQFRSDRAGSTNAELKSSDSSSNPYLALGGLLAAGLDGVKRQLTLGEPTLIDPGNYSDEERATRGIHRFPTTLKEALDNLEKDTVLMEALGPLLARAYLAVKRLEWESFSKEDAAFEMKHHFWKF